MLYFTLRKNNSYCNTELLIKFGMIDEKIEYVVDRLKMLNLVCAY